MAPFDSDTRAAERFGPLERRRYCEETLGMRRICLAITFFGVTALVFASLIAFERMISGLR